MITFFKYFVSYVCSKISIFNTFFCGKFYKSIKEDQSLFVSSFFNSVSGKFERLIGQKSGPEDVTDNDSGRDKGQIKSQGLTFLKIIIFLDGRWQ